MSEMLLEVRDLKKAFHYRGRQIVALDGLSFDLSAGQILGLLGPNGAGKSTALRILTAQMKADEGVVRLFGSDLGEYGRSVRSLMAYVPQAGTLMDESDVTKELVYQARFYGLSPALARARAAEVLQDLGLEDLEGSARVSFLAASADALMWPWVWSGGRSSSSSMSLRRGWTRTYGLGLGTCF